MFFGSNDKLVPVKTAQDFQKQMKMSGLVSELMIFEGQPHGFFNHGRDGNKHYYATVAAADRFLASLGWLSGPPTLEQP